MISDQFSPQNIESKIYLVRGEKVMLDQDLAVLYAIPTEAPQETGAKELKSVPFRFYVYPFKSGA
jgi:hypothetical protein